MAELIREIEEEDLPKLKELLELVFGESEWKQIDRLCGMTNHSYKITLNNGHEYLVRIPGEGTEEMINRLDERKSTELGCKLGIDSPLVYFGDDGCKVMKFIHDPQPMSEEIMRKKRISFRRQRFFENYIPVVSIPVSVLKFLKWLTSMKKSFVIVASHFMMTMKMSKIP